jgi:hypothetical protein
VGSASKRPTTEATGKQVANRRSEAMAARGQSPLAADLAAPMGL